MLQVSNNARFNDYKCTYNSRSFRSKFGFQNVKTISRVQIQGIKIVTIQDYRLKRRKREEKDLDLGICLEVGRGGGEGYYT